MRVIVPATPDGLQARTVPAILASGWACQVEPMLYPEAYFDLVSHLWAQRQTFAIVEHDIEVLPDTLDGFDACPELWCAHSYEVYAGDVADAYGGPYSLGCVRFRAELLARRPDVVERAGQMNIHPVHAPRSYAVMDSTLTQVLRGSHGAEYPNGVPVHEHRPPLTHHHQYVRVNTFPPWSPPEPRR